MMKMLAAVLSVPFLPILLVYGLLLGNLIGASSLSQFWIYALYGIVPFTIMFVGLPALVPIIAQKRRKNG
jgi:hypothetical protein